MYCLPETQSLNEATSQIRSSEMVYLAVERLWPSLLTKYKETQTILVIVLSIKHSEDNEEVKTMDRRAEDSLIFPSDKSIV